jgi:hypothetical protein
VLGTAEKRIEAGEVGETLMSNDVKAILQLLNDDFYEASVYKILHHIVEFQCRSPDDPLLEFLFALYDALAIHGLWDTYTRSQYEKASDILARVAEQPDPQNVENAILSLNQAGFTCCRCEAIEVLKNL